MSEPQFDRHRLSALDRSAVWAPQPGPQLAAYLSKADVLLYGGAAGGGKTALATGLALTSHHRTLFIRKEGIQLNPVIDEIEQMLGNRDGYNGQTNTWRLPGGRVIQFGGVPNSGDETKFMGNPRDLLACDEAANLFESQVRFLMGWVRSTRPGQRCRTLLCSNPPTGADGEWLIRWFAPWFDPAFPMELGGPAKPGELRWVTTIAEKDTWVPTGEPFKMDGELVTPLSRTFIPSRVTDNRYLRGTGYVAQLQALPEPLRSMMLKGDFAAGREDKPFQVIPTEWVRRAQARWKERSANPGPMTAMGIDVARGGKDKTVITPRHGTFFGTQIVQPGKSTPDGPAVVNLALQHRRDNAVMNVDVIGVGASVYDMLRDRLHGRGVVAMNSSHGSSAKDKSGQLSFANKRAEWWWTLREALDPKSEDEPLALPPDPELLADLCSPLWKTVVRGVQVESKEDLQKRIGRSTDKGDSVVFAFARGNTAPSFEGMDAEETYLQRRM